MPTANSSAFKETVTAALLVIGSKILSGRTKDQNVGHIGEYLTAVGIDLKEVGGRRRGDSDRRCAQCAQTSLHLCLHHWRDRADPR